MSHAWRSERLLYRAIETEDEAFLSVLESDAETLMNTAPFIPLPQGKEAAKGFREFLTKQLLGLIVCLPPPVTDVTVAASTNEAATKPIPIGIINLMAEEPRFAYHRRSEIGINLIPEYRGKGYGSEAIKWGLRFGFQRCNLHRIEVDGFAYNERALKLYEKLGFKPESRKREALWHDGRYWDLVGLGMLENEWRELYGKE